jgi:hypothetical protein
MITYKSGFTVSGMGPTSLYAVLLIADEGHSGERTIQENTLKKSIY